MKGLKQYISLALTIVIILSVVIINVLLTSMHNKAPLAIDLTTDKRFTLTAQTIETINAVKIPVTMNLLISPDEFKSAGDMYKQVYETFLNYTKYNKNIKLQYVDTLKDLEFAKKFPNEQLNQSVMIIESEKRYKVINPLDLFKQIKSEYGQTFQSKAEQTLTNAFSYVTAETISTVGVLTGYEGAAVEGYKAMLKANNYDVIDIDPAKAELQGDFIVVPAALTDLDIATIGKLDRYLENGGKLSKSMVYVASSRAVTGKNTAEFLKKWGLSVTDNMVYETNEQLTMGDPFSPISTVVADEIAALLTTQTAPIVTPYCHNIVRLFEKQGDFSTVRVAQTGESNILIPPQADEKFDINAQEKAIRITMAMGVKTSGETNSKLLVIGGEGMIDTNYLEYEQINNGDLILKMSNAFLGKNDVLKLKSIDFALTPITANPIVVNVLIVVLMFVIPVVLIAVGIFISIMRKRRT